MVLNTSCIIFILLAASCFVLSSFVLWQEIREVNKKLSDDQQLSYIGMYTSKRLRIKKEYARSYPSGRLDQIQWALEIAGFIFLLVAVIQGGFLRHWLGH